MPHPLARLAVVAAMAGLTWGGAVGCGGGDGASAAPSVASGAGAASDPGRGPAVGAVLRRQGVSAKDMHPVRFGRIPSRAWVADAKRGSCMFMEVTPGAARIGPVGGQCASRARRERRGLVGTMGVAGSADTTRVYGLAPAGARKALIVGADGTRTLTIDDGRFGVIARKPKFIQFLTAEGLGRRTSVPMPEG